MKKIWNIYSDDNKIKQLDDLHKLLGIEWFDTNMLAKLKVEDKNKLFKKIEVPDNKFLLICNRNMFDVRSEKKTRNLY